MLRISINNKQLWLDPNTKLRFEVKAPYTQSNVIPESVITWFDIPAMQPNIDILNHSHYFEVNRTVRAYNTIVEFGGIQILTGKLIVKNVSGARYRACAISTAFAMDFGTKLLPECLDSETVLGTTTQDVIDYANNAVTQTYPDSIYQFPRIQNDKFYGNEKEFNTDYYAINYYANNSFTENAIVEDPDWDNMYTMLPLPYLNHVFAKLFEYANFKAFGSFLSNSEIQKLIVYNNFPLDEKNQRYYYCRGSLSAPQVVPSFSTGYIEFDDFTTDPNEDNKPGCFNTTTLEFNIPYKGYYYVRVNMKYSGVPAATYEVYGVPIINGTYDYTREMQLIQDVDNVHEFSVFASPAMVNQKIKYAFYTPTSSLGFTIEYASIIFQNTSWDNLNIFSKKINLKNHVPQQVTVSEFLNANKDTFGIATWWDADKREVELQLLSEIIASPEYLQLDDYMVDDPDIEIKEASGYTYNFDFGSNDELVNDNFKKYDNYNYIGEIACYEDLPVSPVINDVVLITNMNKLYIYNVNETTNIPAWIIFADNFYDLVKGKQVFKPALSTLFNYKSTTSNLYRPQISNVASSPAFNTGVNDCDLKLLIYHGMNEDGLGDFMPLASHTAYDYSGTPIGSMELRWDGALGIYENFRKYYDNWINGCERVTAKLNADLLLFEKILEMHKPQKVQKCRKFMYKSIKMLPEQFTFILTYNGIEETEAIFLKPKGIDLNEH